MASGDSRLFQGAYAGTGAGLSITTPGFQPRFLIIINQDDASAALHFGGMPADSCLLIKGGATTFVSSGAVTLTTQGFDLGTNADLNTADETLYFIAGS